jgi:phospholipase D1/2
MHPQSNFFYLFPLGHPHLERWREIGRQFKQYWQGEEALPDEDGHSPFGTCRVQVVRSVGDWSHGVLTEDSVQKACKRGLNCLGTSIHFGKKTFNSFARHSTLSILRTNSCEYPSHEPSVFLLTIW